MVNPAHLSAIVADAAEAHRRIEAGGVHGKIVLTPSA
jgi:hypothetical protein